MITLKNEFVVKITMHSITKYNTDTGNRDYPNERMLSPGTSFESVINEAIRTNARLIVKTSGRSGNPGHWYLKAFNVKQKLETNIINGKHTHRQSWLIC